MIQKIETAIHLMEEIKTSLFQFQNVLGDLTVFFNPEEIEEGGAIKSSEKRRADGSKKKSRGWAFKTERQISQKKKQKQRNKTQKRGTESS